ncbi:MAG TPA: hypothetical protein VGL53_21900 [Bryobacteraceae bacterium]|jgi:hypothetical protein
MKPAILFLCVTCGIVAQEAESGFDLRALIGVTSFASNELTESPRDGSVAGAGFRALLYPTWKLSKHWTVTGVVQIRSRPYFSEDFSTTGYGIKSDVIQATLGYSQFWTGGSVVVRVGELPSAFGSFLLRYSDMDNPLLDMPAAYGYYYRPVTSLGLTGAQVDASWHRFDGRVQLTSSSPTNPRSPWEKDQYANWTVGAGYTIIQGFRVGVSMYRGPYLDRDFPFFTPNELPPVSLPATGFGTDASWARGHTSINGEWQRFQYDYHEIPTFIEQTGYGEIKQVLHPRWFVAGRVGYTHTNYGAGQSYEAAVGLRPSANQLIKFGYQLQRDSSDGHLDHIVGMQYVAAIHPLVLAGH